MEQKKFSLMLLSLLFITLLYPTAKLKAQLSNVKPSSANLSAETSPSTQYIYFKIKESSSLTIPDFKKGDSELPSELALLKGITGIEKIHRPFAMLKTPVLVRTYRVQCENADDVSTIISRLNLLPFVEFVALDKPLKNHIIPNDIHYDKLWGLKKINAEGAWNISTGSSSVTVAVVDVAFRLDHEDLASTLWTNSGEIAGNGIDDDGNGYIDDVNGWDVADNDNDASMPYPLAYYDYMTHGTLCASTAIGASNNYKGIASTGYGCKLIPVKTQKDINWNSNSAGQIWDGIAYAIAANANVVSISSGTPYDPTDPMVSIYQSMIDAGHAAGIVFVASAGNEGLQYLPNIPGIQTPTYKIYPAALNHVISVGSTDPNDKKSGFSNWGYVSDADIYAPGENIYCAFAATTDDYAYASGTSLSAPMVAGVCALIKSANPSYTATQIENCLLNGAYNTDHLNPDYAGLMGVGRLDAKFAVSCAVNTTTDFFIQNSQQVCNSTSATFEAILSDPSYRYFWNFGDGGTANNIVGNTTSHTYTTNGLYTVSLSIKNTGGTVLFTATKNEYVMVTDCNPITSQNTHWYFGNKAGLDFSSGKPVADFNNTLNFLGGSSCITDVSTNNTAFYGGPEVSGGRYEINDFMHASLDVSLAVTTAFPSSIYNGGGLLLKKPGTTSNYNLFIAPFNQSSSDGFYIYDIGINPVPGTGSSYYLSARNAMPAPVGALVDGNGAPYTSSKLTAIEACGTDEYWIITVSSNQNYNPESLYIYKFSPTVSLVNTVAISIDYLITSPIKASPDGSMLAFSYLDAADGNSYTKVYTFNRSTGDLQDQVTLDGGSTGLSFSPDSKLIYLTDNNTSIYATYFLYQYDLTAATPSETKQLINASTNTEILALQLGPDDVIYVNYGETQNLGAIYLPNQKASSASPNACGYSAEGVSLVSSPLQNIHSGNGFPNDVDATEFTVDFSFVPKNCNEVDFKTSICASSYTWYFNDGTASYVQNPTHTFAPGTYIVHLDANGQHVFKNVTIYAPFTASLTMNSTICDRSNGIELKASPTGSQYVYKWYKNGVLIEDYTSNKYWASTTGIYYVEVTDSRGGCTSTSNTYDYDPTNDFKISISTPHSYAGFNGVEIGVDINQYPNTFTSYTWYRDGELLMGPCSCPIINNNLPGTYVLVGKDVCGETISNEFRLKVDPFCPDLADVSPLPPSYLGLINPTYNTTQLFTDPNGIVITGTVTLQNGADITFFNTNLIMGSCSKIIVEQGAILNLVNVNITGCNSWEGIIVQGNPGAPNSGPSLPNSLHGQVYISNSYISEATIGLYSMDGGYFEINNCDFDNNGIHVAVGPYYPSGHFGWFRDSRFKRTLASTCPHSYFASPVPFLAPAVLVDHSQSLRFDNNTFTRDLFAPIQPPITLPYAPMFSNASIALLSSNSTYVSAGSFYKENSIGIYTDDSYPVIISNNTFDGNVFTATYNKQLVGVYSTNGCGIDASYNSFFNCHNGIEFYNHTNPAVFTNFNHNLFEFNNYGAIVAPEDNPITNNIFGANSQTTPINVQFDCNKFLNNISGIVGSGYLVDQGNPSYDASNQFASNADWNILWQNPIQINYNYGSYPDPNTQIGPAYVLNSTLQSVTDINSNGLTGWFTSCYGSWKTSPTSVQNVEQNNISSYPNPFSTKLEIDLSKIASQTVNIKICDVQGKTMYETVLQNNTGKITINTPNWSAGVYILTVSTSTKNHQAKLIKVDY